MVHGLRFEFDVNGKKRRITVRIKEVMKDRRLAEFPMPDKRDVLPVTLLKGFYAFMERFENVFAAKKIGTGNRIGKHAGIDK